MIRPVVAMDPGISSFVLPLPSVDVSRLTSIPLLSAGPPVLSDYTSEIIRLLIDSGTIDTNLSNLRSTQGGMRVQVVRLLVETWTRLRTQHGSRLPDTQVLQWAVIERQSFDFHSIHHAQCSRSRALLDTSFSGQLCKTIRAGLECWGNSNFDFHMSMLEPEMHTPMIVYSKSSRTGSHWTVICEPWIRIYFQLAPELASCQSILSAANLAKNKGVRWISGGRIEVGLTISFVKTCVSKTGMWDASLGDLRQFSACFLQRTRNVLKLFLLPQRVHTTFFIRCGNPELTRW